jgi:hypothetical protein
VRIEYPTPKEPAHAPTPIVSLAQLFLEF